MSEAEREKNRLRSEMFSRGGQWIDWHDVLLHWARKTTKQVAPFEPIRIPIGGIFPVWWTPILRGRWL